MRQDGVVIALLVAAENKNSLQAGAFEKQCGYHTTFYQGIELQDFILMSGI